VTELATIAAVPDVAPYLDPAEHLADELDRLDLLLRIRAESLQRSWGDRPASDGPPGYVSEEDVAWLLGGGRDLLDDPVSDRRWYEELAQARSEIDARLRRTIEHGGALPLARLAAVFGLSDFEADAVLICLAPELRRRYDLIYAYLQDDIARKRPSCDLVLDLLCLTESERWAARAWLAPHAPLIHAGIIELIDDPLSPSGSSGLAQFVRLDPRILRFILGESTFDARLSGMMRLLQPDGAADLLAVDPGAKDAMLGFARRWAARADAARPRVVLNLRGPRGVGKRSLALAVCAELGRPMLVLDATRLPADVHETELLLRLAFRESLLHQAPLYISPVSPFTHAGDEAAGLRTALGQAVEAYGWMTFLAGQDPWPDREPFGNVVFYSTTLPMPTPAIRRIAWSDALATHLPERDAGDLASKLAERFRLTPGQIRHAVAAIEDERVVHAASQTLSFERLAAASRDQAQHELSTLAVKIAPAHRWPDLVLPDPAQDQLVELCGHIRNESVVFDRWGFGTRLTYGRGVSALFSGPPGTGKTMAAEVIAADLQLDLFKVDLARVVSKYIGETEKSLGRIFAEAENSNAILFFDEADALFAKRTDISDAHDRYANLETSYLLQRMEDYGGVVILASNLRENIDPAFIRRLRFVVEFPFPDAASRARIWRAHLPAAAPVDPDIDFAVLGERIQVAGGNIKDIVLNAAFAAASDGGVIGMKHVLHGTRREFEKIGKLWDGSLTTRGRG